jgi:hypothetical protein
MADADVAVAVVSVYAAITHAASDQRHVEIMPVADGA